MATDKRGPREYDPPVRIETQTANTLFSVHFSPVILLSYESQTISAGAFLQILDILPEFAALPVAEAGQRQSTYATIVTIPHFIQHIGRTQRFCIQLRLCRSRQSKLSRRSFCDFTLASAPIKIIEVWIGFPERMP